MENDTESAPDEQASKGVEVQTDRVPIIVCSKCGCEIDVADLDPFVHVECPDCNNIETVPARLGPFLLQNLIGTGGMGGVYYAKDESLGRHVAIKVMLKSIGENKAFVESFKREAQAVARLNHPNIVQIYSFGQEKGQPFIVMELVSGQRFDKMVETKKALDQALVMRIGLDIADGLKAADEAGLLHGDIKPENILLDEKMHAKIVDFGIATFANEGQGDGIWGTPYYIAPEKVRRQKVDCRSDIYSLGATLFHALAGHPPFEGKTPIDVVKARLTHPARALHLLRADVDPFVEKIIARMLEGDQTRRYPNYNSLISDMKKAVQQLGSPGAVSGFSSDISRKTGKVYTPKKHATSPVSGEPGQDIPPPQPTRLVIHKKSGATLIAPPHTTQQLAESKKKSEGATEQKKAKQRKVGKTIFWLIFLGCLIGGGIAIAKYSSNKKADEVARKREAYNLKQEGLKADGIYRKVLVLASNAIVLAKGTEAMANQASNAVFAVLGETLDLPEVAPEEAAPPAQPAAAETNKVAEPAKAPADPAKPADAAAKPSPEPAKPAESPAAVAPPKRRAPPPDEPEPKPTARKVIAAVEKLVANVTAAQQLQADATTTRNEAVTAKTAAIASGKVKVLDENLATAEALVDSSKSALDDAQKALKKVLDKKAEKEASLEAEKKAAAEREAAAAAAEADKKKAEQLKKLVENELTLIEAARNSCLPMMKQHKYKDIVDTLSTQVNAYQTDEGKAAFKVLIDRYTRLQKMKTFVVAQLNADPFKWGMDIPRVGSMDVIGADEIVVKIKDRSIPWTEVSTAQMKKFLDHYLGSSKLPVKVLAEQNVAAAIFCFENGGLKAAPGYAEKAVELAPDLQAEVKRLLPLEY